MTIPTLGLGVYQIKKGKETEQAILDALEAGYRHFDTASYYKNEESVGNAIREGMRRYGISREEIFVTTKLWPVDFSTTRTSFDKSFKKLNLGYIDLYLIHWPVLIQGKKAWKELIKIKNEGQVRSIGVSNYSSKQIEELIKDSGTVPEVNQVEFHPFAFKKELLEYCNSKGIILEAYSPLTRGKRLDHPVLQEIAKKYQKSPAQILIRWCIEHDTVVIPKSSKKERIIENSKVFDFKLDADDVLKLDALDENWSSLF